jgi:polar amino acid transport system substrate-binding protein
VTPECETSAAFVAPYLISGQSLAVDTSRLPHVRSIDDLAGLAIGVQHGNTSQPIPTGSSLQARLRAFGYTTTAPSASR